MRSDLPPPLLRLRIDREALRHNWQALDRLSGAAAAGAAVKANAYGLGIDQVAPVLRDAGAAAYFVAHWSEVPALLAHVPPQQVSVLHGIVQAEDAQFAHASGVRPVINSLHQAQVWLDSGGGPCDLMIDTGINRLGLPTAFVGDPLIARLEIETLMSHLASADDDAAQNERQLGLFEQAARALPARRYSLANSAGIALGPRYAFDLTRPGLALYGGVPRRELAPHIRQVAYPQAAVMQIRELAAGDTVGYNATYTAPGPMRAAVVSIGYADGLLRCWSSKAQLLHRELALPVLGRVSMDMVVADCTAAADLREGDWLDLPYNLPQSSEISGLSQYELLTLLGNRLARS